MIGTGDITHRLYTLDISIDNHLVKLTANRYGAGIITRQPVGYLSPFIDIHVFNGKFNTFAVICIVTMFS